MNILVLSLHTQYLTIMIPHIDHLSKSIGDAKNIDLLMRCASVLALFRIQMDTSELEVKASTLTHSFPLCLNSACHAKTSSPSPHHQICLEICHWLCCKTRSSTTMSGDRFTAILPLELRRMVVETVNSSEYSHCSC